jgi:hypothetical protein
MNLYIDVYQRKWNFPFNAYFLDLCIDGELKIVNDGNIRKKKNILKVKIYVCTFKGNNMERRDKYNKSTCPKFLI